MKHNSLSSMKYIDGNESIDCLLSMNELNKELEENWNKIEQKKNDNKVKHIRYRSNDLKCNYDKRDKSLQHLKNVIERTRCKFKQRQLTDINNESLFESFIKEKAIQMKKQLKSEGNILQCKYNTNNYSHVKNKEFKDRKSFLITEQHKSTENQPIAFKMNKQYKQNVSYIKHNNDVNTYKDSPIYSKIKSIYNALSCNLKTSQNKDSDYTNNINVNNISLKDLHIHFNDIFTSITPNVKISKQVNLYTRSTSPFIQKKNFNNKMNMKTNMLLQSSKTLGNKNNKWKSIVYTKKIFMKSNSNIFHKSTPTLSKTSTSISHLNQNN